MKAAIDLRALSTPYEHRGIGFHVRNMAEGLPEIAPDIEFVFFLGDIAAARYLPDRSNVSSVVLKRGWKRRWLEDLVRLPGEIKASGAHLFHGPVVLGPLRDLNIPVRSPVPVISTIYDMHVEILDDPQMAAYRREWRYRIQRWAARRTTVVTCSEYTKCLLLERGAARPGHVHLIPISIRPPAGTPPPKENIVLFIGDSLHKNTAAAVSVFKVLSTRAPEWRFVMVGSRERIHALAGLEAKALQAAHILQIEENVPEVVMESLFAKARILFMPSLSEGFGVPVLQAFAGGTCAVISDRGSLPEVGGDAAVYVNPEEPAEMVSTLEGLIKNDSLQQALIERGLRRIKKYSWNEHLGRLAGLYREVARHE